MGETLSRVLSIQLYPSTSTSRKKVKLAPKQLRSLHALRLLVAGMRPAEYGENQEMERMKEST